MSSPAFHQESIACGCSQPVAVRIYRAAAREGRAALVLHLHGGAFVDGDLAAGSTVASVIADAGAVVVSLDYPLAPEHPFPQAAEAAHAALAWVHRNRRRLAGAHAPLFVAGEEAGGNLAAAAALMARDRDGPVLAGQMLLSPMLDACIGTASWRCTDAGPVGCTWADGWRKYLARASDALHPYASPGTSMRLDGLPPTLLVTAQDDPLRDETRSFAQRLRDANVPVDEAVVTAVTGWPRSYRHSMHAAPWAGAVRRHVERFLCAQTPAA